MPIGQQESGVTSGVKFVTSTVGNTVGGVTNTVGGVVGALGRGVGETLEGATGSAGRPVARGIVIRHVSKTALPEQCAEVVCAYKMRRLREAFRMLKIPVAEYTEGSPQHDDPFGCVKPKDYLAIYRHTSIARRTQPWRSPQTTSFCIGVPVQGTPKRTEGSIHREIVIAEAE
ncbi:hypothetical protein AALT_g3760 [Alternaria alternata]|nr:hypothetical protein AALT_g3760 [Alternaria alternata]